MPTYEISLVVKQALKRPEMVQAVKRMGESVINNGGYIRNLEFLGHRNLPQRQRANNEWHTKGSYFIMKIDLPIAGIDVISDIAKRDQNVIRHNFVSVKPLEEPECTLEDEFKPPAERPSVQAMIELGRKKPTYRRIYKSNTGLDFNPLIR